MYEKVCHPGGRKIAAERRPMRAIVDGDKGSRIRSCVQKPGFDRIGAHDADEMIAWKIARYLAPALAVIARAENVRLEIIDPMTVRRRIRNARLARGQIDRGHLRPLPKPRRRHVAPMRAAVFGELDQAIVCSNPDLAGTKR